MGDVVAIVAPFFSTPTNYAQMLKKLAGFAFWETYIATFFLRDIPAIGQVVSQIEKLGSLGQLISSVPILGVMNISGFALALVIAILSHAVHLHDRISDLFGIRKRFDAAHIMFPLAQLVGAALSDVQKEKAIKLRDSLMRDVFYRYASSKAEQPIVDKHDIQHALAQWSWYWVCVEGSLYFLVAAIIGFALGAHPLGLGFLAIALIFAALGILQHGRLPRYAKPQIETIAQNVHAASHVRAVFSAL